MSLDPNKPIYARIATPAGEQRPLKCTITTTNGLVLTGGRTGRAIGPISPDHPDLLELKRDPRVAVSNEPPKRRRGSTRRRDRVRPSHIHDTPGVETLRLVRAFLDVSPAGESIDGAKLSVVTDAGDEVMRYAPKPDWDFPLPAGMKPNAAARLAIESLFDATEGPDDGDDDETGVAPATPIPDDQLDAALQRAGVKVDPRWRPETKRRKLAEALRTPPEG